MIIYCYYRYISFNIKGKKDGNLRPTSLVTEGPPMIPGNDAAECQSLPCPYLVGKTYLTPKMVEGKKTEGGGETKSLLAFILMCFI